MRRLFSPAAALSLALTLIQFGCTPSNEQSTATSEPPEAAMEAPPSPSSSTYFSVTGAFELTVNPAEASIAKNRVDIWALAITSSPESVRKLGQSYMVNLFFSKDFTGAPGTYPIRFAYLNETNTLGGSFYSGDLFSHDTNGTAEFAEFGEEIVVSFEFTTYSASEGSADRKSVTVKGEARCPRGDFP